ncbi:MAG: hypothetical protein C0524_10925 [Rhodobacter sp.]|nr:hypothetical protein [Rhodobacter sp.]
MREAMIRVAKPDPGPQVAAARPDPKAFDAAGPRLPDRLDPLVDALALAVARQISRDRLLPQLGL